MSLFAGLLMLFTVEVAPVPPAPIFTPYPTPQVLFHDPVTCTNPFHNH